MHNTTTDPAVVDYKTPFLLSCLESGALTFGSYTLKSGRQSPYFFNAGLLHHGGLLLPTAKAYATILSSPPFVTANPAATTTTTTTATTTTPLQQLQVNYDVLFGPAYKGIPFAAATLTVLASTNPAFERVSYGFNRKEAKDHGEGGITVGAPLEGKRVVIVDDVITAGTALREAVGIIRAAGGVVVGVVLLLDREERTRGENDATGGVMDTGKEAEDEEEEGALSAVGSAEKSLGVPVRAIVGLSDLIEVLGGKEGMVERRFVDAMEAYRRRYGARK